jgi:hypothetical protein
VIQVNELKEKIDACDKGDNLEVKIAHRISMGDSEPDGTIIVERVITPDYIRITRIFKPIERPIRENRPFKR